MKVKTRLSLIKIKTCTLCIRGAGNGKELFLKLKMSPTLLALIASGDKDEILIVSESLFRKCTIDLF